MWQSVQYLVFIVIFMCILCKLFLSFTCNIIFFQTIKGKITDTFITLNHTCALKTKQKIYKIIFTHQVPHGYQNFAVSQALSSQIVTIVKQYNTLTKFN